MTDTIAVLMPGDMGHATGAVLIQHGHDVITCLDGRSDHTKELAASAGFRDVGTLDAIVSEADLVLSILPPAAALGQATDVVGAMDRTGAKPVYVDCNAISPATARDVCAVIDAAGAPVRWKMASAFGSQWPIQGELGLRLVERLEIGLFGPAEEPVVGLMTEWTVGNQRVLRQADGDLGGTMRLGAYDSTLKAGSRIAEIYGTTDISERHRHRYEVNINYREAIEAKAGLIFAGLSPDGVLPETVERTDHPWFIGVQYHPELKSRPFAPHPLFASFIEAAVKRSRLV